MSDAIKELVIRIKRDSAAALADQRAYHAAERKAIQQSLTDAQVAERAKTEFLKRENRQRIQEAARAARTTVEQAKAAEKAKADAAKATAAAAKQAQKEIEAAGKKAVAEARKDAKDATAAAKQAQAARVEASKKAAADIIASTRQMIAESKRLEREMFAEGRRLAAESAATDKRDAQNAIVSSKLAFSEKKKHLDDQKRATDEAAAATRQMTRALLGTQVAGAALNAVKVGIDAVAQSAADARARIAAMNAEAAAARFSDREVAALTGNKPTVAFSASLAGQAAQAGVSPEVYRQAQTAFQAQAGQFVGTDELAKVNQQDADELLQRVSSFSASQGVNVADSAKLMGTIIGKSAKGTSKQDLMSTFGKVFKGVQLAPGETGPLLNQLSELIQEEVGQGGSFNSVLEALPLIRVMAERNPGEASTYGRALIRGLRDINSDPRKAAEVGITKGMSFLEQVQAVDKSATASGDEGAFLNKFFPDIRGFGGVRTALNAGTRGGGFARVARDMAGVNDQAITGVIQDYLGGEEGKAQANASREQQARLEQAASPGMRLLAEARARASTSLESAGGLNQGEGLFGSIFTAAGQAAGYGDRKQQEETALVGTELAQRLSGYPGGREFMKREGLTPNLNPFSFGSRMASESSLAQGFNLLNQLREAAQSLKDAGDAIKSTKQPVPTPAPARPPAGPGRVGG